MKSSSAVLRSWWGRSLAVLLRVSSTKHPARRDSQHPLRLQLVELEDRRCPTTFTVNAMTDTGAGAGFVGDLRYCINQANSTAGADSIVFDTTVFAMAQSITLGGTQLTLSDTSGTTTITGPAAGVTVSANKASRVVQVNASVTATLSGLTVTQGTAVNGAGVYNSGTLMLTNCTVSRSTAPLGGGILNDGTVTLTNSIISGNSSTNNGGGMLNLGTATLTNSTISGNNAVYGAGIRNTSTLTLTNSTVSGNNAIGEGGGVDSISGTATLTNSTFNGNSATFGGGVFVNGGTGTLTNCTLSGNTATNGNGAGIATRGGTTTVASSTISGNTATMFGNGGGMYNNGGTTTVINTIVAGNSSNFGNDIRGSFEPTSTNNLIGDDTGSIGIANGTNGNQVGTFGSPLNPLLAPLGNYGGPTQTRALLPGSPAIDAGSLAEVQTVTVSGSSGTFTLAFNGSTTAPLAFNAAAATVQSALNNLPSIVGAGGSVAVTLSGGVYTVTFGGALATGNQPQLTAVVVGGTSMVIATVKDGLTINTEQRGLPRIVNGTIDIGAFESSGFTIGAIAGTPQSTSITSAFGTTLVATVTPNNPSEPVAGGTITFTSPSAGASATLTGNPAGIAANSQASVNATANGTTGAYSVTATTRGIVGAASFSLTNTAIPTTVSSITRTTPTGQFTNASSATYTVSLSNATLGLTASNFNLTGTAGILNSNIGTPSTNDGGLTWTIPITGLSGANGVLVLNLVNGTGLDRTLSNLPFSGEIYTLDNTAPTVSVTTPAAFINGALGGTNTNTVTITYSDSDSGIDTTTFANSNISVTNGATVTGFSAVGNVVTYTITAPATTWSASPQATYTIGLVSGAGAVKDLAGNSVLANVSFNTFIVLTTLPTPISILRTTPTAQFTNAASVTFTATFSTPVQNVTAGNFALSGTAKGGTIGIPTTADGGLTWSIPVTGLASRNGTLELDLVKNPTRGAPPIGDLLGNPLATATLKGQAYTLDHVAPTATSIVGTTPVIIYFTTSPVITYVVTFSKPVQNVTAANFSLIGTTGGFVGTPTTSDGGKTWTVLVTGMTISGTLELDLTSNAGITDLAGNALVTKSLKGQPYVWVAASSGH